jgi:hypothetical protein
LDEKSIDTQFNRRNLLFREGLVSEVRRNWHFYPLFVWSTFPGTQGL